MTKLFYPSIAALLLAPFSLSTWAWDYEGHRLVNQIALASLPPDFPVFVLTPVAQERIAFLAGEPDRWRNTPDLTLKHLNAPDHFLDIEHLALAGMTPDGLSPFRYEFAAQLALARQLHPANFPAVDPDRNLDHTRTLIGFLPWTVTEYYGKLKSAFSYLKAFQDSGTPEEIANAQQNIIYLMGVMGHFVGDGSQPLHTTKHFNGWVGDNPKRYPTNGTFHAWVDGGYLRHAEIKLAELQPRRAQPLLGVFSPNPQQDIFPVVMKYLMAQHQLVEPLYRLEKDRKLDGNHLDPEGRKFFTRQLTAGGEMLGDLWLTAWEQAPPDKYLKAQLANRNAARPAK